MDLNSINTLDQQEITDCLNEINHLLEQIRELEKQDIPDNEYYKKRIRCIIESIMVNPITEQGSLQARKIFRQFKKL